MLCGRDPERARIRELLDDARESSGGVLVIRGEPGVGKSALLEDARELAGDMRVLSSRGVETESSLPFAALHQLVRPILDDLEHIPAPQAGALRGALGLAEPAGDDRFLVALACLSLLAEAAERTPLLCLVDDARWLDDASAEALVFVARRLERERIAMLFAARETEARQVESPGLPTLELGGLDHGPAGELIDRTAGAALPSEIRDRLIVETGGNPLALLELSSALSPEQLSGAEPLFTPIPVSARVERAFLARVRRLPEDTQTVLLVAAADDTGSLATVLRAAGQLGAATEALDAAEEAGLAHVRGAELELRHPLVRSAVYHGAPLSKRQAAHRALADVLDGEAEADRRAWHRAAASVEPDPAIAAELERAAERARRRSGHAPASLALERAASLAGDEHERARLLTAAGKDAWVAGQTERARTLLERARPLAEGPIERADIDASLGLIEMTRGVPADACRLLLGAAEEVAQADGMRALALLNLASIGAVYAGDPKAHVAIAHAATDLNVDDTPDAHTLVELLVGLGAHFEDDFEAAAPKLRAALALEETASDPGLWAQPVSLFFAGRAAVFLGDDQAIVRGTQAAASLARANGLLGLLTHILPRLGHGEHWTGRLASAAANAREGLQLARDLDQPHLIAHELAVLATVAAQRGEEAECRSLAAESYALASRYGLTLVAGFVDWAIVLLELGLGNAEAAFERARGVSTSFVVFWATLDRVEAALRAGKREAARKWFAGFEAWAESGGIAWACAVALHCRALLSEDEEEAGRLFTGALEEYARAARPFEEARTELAYGEFLRRRRRRVEARRHLREALDGFEGLGATPWAERARVELRASGQTARRRDASTRDELTEQEVQIARFVARGLSNREVAAQLFLSPRTIDFHLRNIFRKLDITSRTQLANLELDGDRAPEPDRTEAAARA
jgi:DNA-binding CsgD family transcriptional regulator/tetratricopeptide (TPR) repeat protein